MKQARPDSERDYLTPDEMERLRATAKKTGRYTHRDSTLLLLMYRHGLRVGEAVDLQWRNVNFTTKHLYVKRLKRGVPSNQPFYGDEVRVLRQLQRKYCDLNSFRVPLALPYLQVYPVEVSLQGIQLHVAKGLVTLDFEHFMEGIRVETLIFPFCLKQSLLVQQCSPVWFSTNYTLSASQSES
ncbi:tyrosine-type recombinase/integrase [Coleofasciculus sp. FACHB-64]|uniref:tyrosine-type recombinase/integrase n=1 Tax=Cyanophyceae TaxID=3028117 RepID=UPI0032200440